MTPEQMLSATDLTLGVASAAATGAGLGFGSAKLYDRHNGPPKCKPVPKVKAKAKPRSKKVDR